jgi:PhnB protein
LRSSVLQAKQELQYENRDQPELCWLEVGDQAMMGADMDVGWAPNIEKPKNGFDVTLHSTSIDEARRWFDQLSAGGKVNMPFG